MFVQNKSIDAFIESPLLKELLLKSTIGLESEMNRIISNGRLSKKEYPQKFGDRRTHPYLQTDFTEGMFELITPANTNIQECLESLDTLLQITRGELTLNEGLWPLSMPPFVDKDDIEWLGRFSKRSWEMDYHKYLVKKYGALHGIISGLHFNFSFNETLINYLHKGEPKLDYIDFKNQFYFKIAQNIEKYRWVFHLSFR